MRRLLIVLVSFLIGCGGEDVSNVSQPTRGITDDRIVIGSHNDLSGPLATHGVPLSRGARLRFNQANAKGGVHGRKIEFVVEDNAYQVPAAVKAVNKLLNVDNIFLMVGSLGTPHNNAVMPRMFESGVPNLFPATAAVQMYEPLHPLKFAYFISYRDQIVAGMTYMVQQHGFQQVCLQSVANDYGEEVRLGFDKAVEKLGLEVAYVGRHKGTETDFAGTVTSIKNSSCEFLVLGPFIKDALLIYTAARDAGWTAPVMGNQVPYAGEVATGADGGMEGFYACAPFRLPDYESELAADSWIGRWYREYEEAFGEPPPGQAPIGYVAADLTVKALEAAGPELTTEKVLAALENMSFYEDPFGGPSLSFSPTKHQGGDYLNLYQVQNKKWRLVATELPY